MLIGFFDDTDLLIDGNDVHPDIFVYGGYFIEQTRLSEFQARIVEAKERHGLSWHAPVKWNMRDATLHKFYDNDHLLNENVYKTAFSKSNELRRDLLSLLVEFDAVVMVSARYDISYKEEDIPTYFGWAFENLLQRMGLMVQSRYPNKDYPGIQVVADWPSTSLEKRMFDVYLGGYHFGHGVPKGQDYLSGPLKKLGFADSLFHTSTLHSGPLQIADMVVGCARDFLAWAIKESKPQRIKGLFDLIVPLFYHAENGNISDYGFKLAKGYFFNNKFFHLESKIAEFVELSKETTYTNN